MNEQTNEIINDGKNEKFEFLYEFAKASFDEELTRFRSIEDKASKFIGLLSIMILGYTAIIRFSGKVFFPPENTYQWITIILIFLTFLALVSSWSLLFRTLCLIEMPRLKFDEEYIQEFKENSFSTNHYLLSMACSKVLAEARESNSVKTNLLNIAYRDMTYSAWFLSLSLLMLTITAYAT